MKIISFFNRFARTLINRVRLIIRATEVGEVLLFLLLKSIEAIRVQFMKLIQKETYQRNN